MNARKQLATILAAGALAALSACGGGGGGGQCEGAKCDDLDKPDSEIPDSPCDGVMVDRSGRGNQKVAGRLHDPVAELAFRAGDDCPASFQDIMAKLRANDTEGCDGDERAGIATRAVSETAQATDSATSYRLVTTRTCDSRPTHSVLFSLFGVRAGASSLPDGVEIIAFDDSSGVFNYYKTDGRSVSFFGNSVDMLKGAQGNDRACARCHTGGGLVMKELDTPWLHWEGHKSTPGASELIGAHADLGQKTDGAEFEFVVKSGNEAWNRSRIEFLQERGTIVDLLRPLFCSVEVNIDNGADFESPVGGGPGGSQISSIPIDSLLDPQLAQFGSIPISFDDYDALIAENGQTVEGIPGAVDTVFDYAFIERSHIDNDYVNKLKEAGVLDDELIKDVLMVDFTRPIFSEDRCGLLDSLPIISPTDATPAAIRDGLIANLGSPSEGTPAFELLTNLENSGGHDATVESFLNACRDLPQADFLSNALTITSLNRKIADPRDGNFDSEGLHVFEFAQTMPRDSLTLDRSSRLHPATCELTGGFVAVAEPSTAIRETFDGPGANFDDGTGSGTHDQEWTVWYDGDKWGTGYTLSLGAGVQTIATRSGSWGLRRSFGDIGGKTARITASFTGDGWYEVMANDTILVKHESSFDGTDVLTLPPGTTEIKFKMGSLNDGSNHSVLIDELVIE